MKINNRGVARLAVVLLGLATFAPLTLLTQNTYAAQITSRSLTLQDGSGTNYASKPSGIVNHKFDFKLATNSTIHSIGFQYCTTADGTCNEPHGMDTTTITLGAQTGLTFDSVVNTNQGDPYVTSAAGVSVTGGTTVYDVILQHVTNPDGSDCTTTPDGCTFYVRITSYTSADATTGATDAGVVAASVNQAITLSGVMPESLVFCTGGTISTTSGVPDCTTASSGTVAFNQDFSPTATATATSQMAASTNATSGYVVTVEGPTLKSGSNAITAIGSTPAASVKGSGQFGLNLVVNATPAVGTAVAPTPNGTNLRGQASANFNTADNFAFSTPGTNQVAASDNGGAGPTDAQIYTMSYIVNVAGSQAAGTYTTTLTYICTPTF